MKGLLTATLITLALCGSTHAQETSRAGSKAQGGATSREASIALAKISAMPGGTWAQYGTPWNTLPLDRDIDNCGPDLGAILGAWNGGLWDGRYFWQWSGGGHGDGCFNGILRYDLQEGRPEVVVPHLQLNMPVLWLRGTADYHHPYVSETPWPACEGMGPNCLDLPKADRLANGPTIPQDDFQAHEGLGNETFGTFLRPRSSHMWNNMARVGDYVYLTVGGTYGGAREDKQVWRFNISDPENTIERLPDRPKEIGIFVNWVVRSGKPPLIVSGSSYCEADPAAGLYDCKSGPFAGIGTLAWDESRNGFWMLDSGRQRLLLIGDQGGQWVEQQRVQDPRLDGNQVGNGGLCIVPTDSGSVPVIWGGNPKRGASGRLLRLDGSDIVEISGQIGQPADAASSVLNKWTWREDLGVCLGTWRWDQGFWAWKPDFASWKATDPAPAADPEPAPSPAPDPAPEPRPAPIPNTNRAPDPGPDASLPAIEFSTFAGHLAAPMPVFLAPWDQPAALEPEAPDVAALCPGPWVKKTYDPSTDLRAEEAANRGTANVRVYLEPGIYSQRLKFDRVQCAEVIAKGKVIFEGQSIGAPEVGIIVRGVTLNDGHVTYTGNLNQGRALKFQILHGVRMAHAGPLLATARPEMPLTYFEFKGVVFGPNPGWHGLYMERSCGTLVARGSVFYGSGRGAHTFKNLCNLSILEGNVFSNVGLDGQPLSVDRRGHPQVGLFSLDLYACNDVVFRDNTVIFGNYANFVRAYMGSRSRNAWGGCNKGRRLTDGSRERFQPGSPEYNDPAVWNEIQAAIARAGSDYAAWQAEPWLTTYLVENNTFIGFNAASVPLITMDSQRPLMTNEQEAVAKPRYRSLADRCAGDAACWKENADPALLYVYTHADPAGQRSIVENGKPPNAQPVPVPEGWRERAAHFVAGNTQILCTPDCTVSTEPFTYRLPEPQYDEVVAANPPRIYGHK